MSGRNNPFEEIERLFERMGRSFEDTGMMGVQDVSVDLADRGDEFVATVDLPGYDKEDVDLSVSERRLTISAERERDTEAGDESYIRRERSHKHVSRTITLPEEVDEEGAGATYRHGVLTITLPKRTDDEDDARRIDID